MLEAHESPARDPLLTRLQRSLGDRFTVERELGRGGMGVVFLAHDRRHDRLVAIKALNPELATTARRFLSEIRLAANLTHPHIVTVYDSGEADGLLYYVMPYVEGESLRDRLAREGPLPVHAALRITRDVAGALAFAHARGVVHRDIKPENILLAHGHASVADFGVAHAVSTAADERLTATGLILGSPPYLSPEQTDPAATLDGRADLYSVGCMLHEMLAGAPPFGSPGAQACIYRHLTEAPPPLRSLRPDVPAAVEAAVLRVLAKNPDDRFAGANELLQALDGSRAPAPSSATVPPPATAPSRATGAAAPSGTAPAPRRVVAGSWRGRSARAAAVVGAVAMGVTISILTTARPAPASGVVSMMVLPFDSWSGSRSSLRQEVPPEQWLTSSLGLLPIVRVMDGRRLAGGRDPGAAADPEMLRDARRGGASYVLSGAALGGRRITIRVHSTRDGAKVYDGSTLPGESPEQALDRMALEVVRVLADLERLDLGAFGDVASTTTSLEALTLLVQGQRMLVRGQPDEAVAAFRRAIRADSSFGPAYYRLSVAETWFPRWDYPAALAAAEAGLRRADEMPPRWAELLRAQRHAVRLSADSAQFQFQKVLGENPQMMDALLGAGEVAFHWGGLLGGDPVQSRVALESVVRRDSGFAPIHRHLVDVGVQLGDETMARRYLPHVDSIWHPAMEAMVALRFGDAGQRAAALRSLEGAERPYILHVVTRFMQNGLEYRIADTLSAFLTREARPEDDRVRGVHHRLAALTAEGRWSHGLRLWDSIAGAREFDAWIVHAYLAGHPVGGRVTPMLAWARDQMDAGRIPRFTRLAGSNTAEFMARDGFRGLVLVAMLHGDSAQVRDLIRRIDAAAAQAPASDPEPDGLRASLRARLALLAGDTSAAIRHLEAATARISWGNSLQAPLTDAAPQRLLLAALYKARHEDRKAEQRLRSFGRAWLPADALFLEAVREVRAGGPPPFPARISPSR